MQTLVIWTCQCQIADELDCSSSVPQCWHSFIFIDNASSDGDASTSGVVDNSYTCDL